MGNFQLGSTAMTKAQLIQGCVQVGCNLVFSIEDRVLEGIVRFATVSEGDTLISVEVNGDFYELFVHANKASVVEPLYREAA